MAQDRMRSLMSIVPIARGVKAALAAEDAKYELLPAQAEMPRLPEPKPMLAIDAARAAFSPEPEPVNEPSPSLRHRASRRRWSWCPSPACCSVQAQDGLMMGAVCTEPEGHKGPHKASDGSWPK